MLVAADAPRNTFSCLTRSSLAPDWGWISRVISWPLGAEDAVPAPGKVRRLPLPKSR